MTTTTTEGLELVVLDELGSDPLGDDCMMCDICYPVMNQGKMIKTLCGKDALDILSGYVDRASQIPCPECQKIAFCPQCGEKIFQD